jgi:hypothetical protein
MIKYGNIPQGSIKADFTLSMWITLWKNCGKIDDIFLDRESGIVLIISEYNNHECYGRND